MKIDNEFKLSEIELVYKSKTKASERPIVSNSNDAYLIFVECWNSDKIELQEQFKVLFLNRGNQVLGIYQLSEGGVTGTVADPKLIFAAALKMNACNLIIAHNHPSGNFKPSKSDEDLTEKIKQAASFFDMKLLDHLIVTSESYFSFADEGIL